MKGINFNTSLTNTAPTSPRQNNSVGETASQHSFSQQLRQRQQR